VTESEGSSGRYLYGVLMDGSRIFRYRSRVRALLGLPTCEGVKVSYGSISSNLMDFTYPHTQSRGEFDLPDQTPDKPGRGITSIEDDFINSPAHPNSDLQRAKPAQHEPEQKAYFSKLKMDQPLYNAESMAANEKPHSPQFTQLGHAIEESKQAEISDQIPSLSRVDPVHLPTEAVRKANANRPEIEGQHNIQIPGTSKNETTRAAKTQLPSGVENAEAAYTHLESSGHLLKDEALDVPEVQTQSRGILPSIHPSPASVPSRQTPLDLTPYQSTLPPIRPDTKRIQDVERIEADFEEQGRSVESLQFPAIKMQTRERGGPPKPTLSPMDSESKSSQVPEGSQNDLPTPAQPVTVLWRGIESKPKNFAFWERRHLRHFRLRLLR